MADNVKDWDPNPDNNTAAPPLGAPENATFIADCNNIDRQIMADARSQFEDQGWFNWGHVATNAGTDTFTIPTDVTGIYTTKRKLRINDATDLYVEVVTSTYSDPNTIVTVTPGGLTAAMNGQTVSTGLPIEAGVGYTEDETDALLDGKMDLVTGPTNNNAMVTDGAGQAQDAGVPLAAVDVTVIAASMPAANGVTNTPHGMTSWTFVIVELIATGGGAFSAGDRIPVPVFSQANQSKSTPNIGFTAYVSATNVTLKNASTDTSGNDAAIFDSAGALVELTSANFSVEATFVTLSTITL